MFTLRVDISEVDELLAITHTNNRSIVLDQSGSTFDFDFWNFDVLLARKVEQFVYLGGNIMAEADVTADIRCRTGET